MFKLILKILLFIFIWAIVGLIVIGGGILAGFEVDLTIQIYAAIFVVWFVFFVLIKKTYQYFIAKKRVEALVNLSESEKSIKFTITRLLGLSSGSNLEKRFRLVQQFLRKSKLKNEGDPDYILPWYLIVGDNDETKINLYKKSDLTETVFDSEVSINSDGYSFDWFFTNNAVFIDTPTSIFSSSESGSSDEWITFSRLLRKYRSKECLNGIIVTIDAAQLLNNDRNALSELGRNWRRKIDDLFRTITMNVPIYLMITGLDKIEGADTWWSILSRDELREAFGALVDSPTAGSKSVLIALDTIVGQLRSQQFDAVYANKSSSALLMFPQKISELKISLDTFTESLFEYSAYQEMPAVRGLYFSGNCELPNENVAAHSKAFLNTILPSQRGLIAPLESAVKKEKLFGFYWRAAWLVLVIAVMTKLFFVYQDNVGYFTDVTDKNSGQFIQRSDYASRIDMLDHMRSVVDEVDKTMNGWWIPWYSSQSLNDFTDELQDAYLSRYQSELGDDINKHLFDLIKIESNKKDKDHAVIGELVSVISKRIILLETHLAGGVENDLVLLADPYVDANWLLGDKLTYEHVEKVNRLYIYYLIWSDDKEKLKNELILLKRSIDKLVLVSEGQLDWIMEWANNQLRGQDILLNKFWKSSGRFDNSIKVRSAFTLGGKAIIDDLLVTIQHKEPIDKKVTEQIKSFRKLYQKIYISEWENFLKRFSVGSDAFRGRQEFLDSIELLSQPENPYFTVLDESFLQLSPWIDAGADNKWISLLSFYQDMKLFSPNAPVDNGKRNKTLSKMAIGLLAKAGPIGKALAKTGKSALKSKKKLDKTKGKPAANTDFLLEDSGRILGEYVTALGEISLNSEIESVSYLGMVNLFNNPDNLGAGEGPEARAYETVRKLQYLLGKRSRSTEAFWAVYAGSIYLSLEYMLNETSCYVQDYWENSVLVDIQGLPVQKEIEVMLGEEGKLWNFVLEDKGKPFLSKKYNLGYVSKRVKEFKIPFTPTFLDYLNKSGDLRNMVEKDYPVRVAAKPTGTSKDAFYLPNRTALSVQCGTEVTDLVNLNYLTSKLFMWNKQCNKVELKIDMGRFSLKKQFDGDKPFLDFMQMFKDGTERFYPRDFPMVENKLIDNKIEFIDVNFDLSGHVDVFNAQLELPSATPKKISSCWAGAV